MKRKTALQRQTELMADRIEEALRIHGAPGEIEGGTVAPRWIRFDFAPYRMTRINSVERLANDVAAALDVENVRISRRGLTLAIEVPRDNPKPVRLIPWLSQLKAIGSATALLGIADDGQPLLIKLTSPNVAHILVSGTTGSGKTVLLRDIVLSLALTNSRGRLALVLIDPRGGQAFDAFATLPHLIHPVVRRATDAADVLASLAALMDQRDQDGVSRPPVIVAIDELADLLMTQERATEPITRLLQLGRGAGIHVIAATQKPTAAVLGPLVKANFPVRLVGKVASSTDARVAAGWGGTGAERLGGRGDFLAIAEGRVARFQAAWVTEDEIATVLHEKGWTKPTSPALALAPPEPEAEVEPEQNDPVDEHARRLREMEWDLSESYRAACRALGEVEGGNPFLDVKAAVDRLRATANATDEKSTETSRRERSDIFLPGSDSGSSPWIDWIRREVTA